MRWSRRKLFCHSASALCTCVSLSDRCESCCLSCIPTMSKAIAKTKHKGDSSLRFRLCPSLPSLHYERGYTQAVHAWPAWGRSMRSQLSREPTAHIVSGFRYARFAPGRLSSRREPLLALLTVLAPLPPRRSGSCTHRGSQLDLAEGMETGESLSSSSPARSAALSLGSEARSAVCQYRTSATLHDGPSP